MTRMRAQTTADLLADLQLRALKAENDARYWNAEAQRMRGAYETVAAQFAAFLTRVLPPLPSSIDPRPLLERRRLARAKANAFWKVNPSHRRHRNVVTNDASPDYGRCMCGAMLKRPR